MFDLRFDGMGLFEYDGKWIHPEKIEKTYEIIYVVNGEVNICEGDKFITAKRKNLIILSPGVPHKGFKESISNTSFYWIHFYADELDLDMPFFAKDFGNSYIFKELNHLNSLPRNICPQYILDTYIAYIVAQLIVTDKRQGIGQKTSDDIYEWVRVNVDAKLTVNKVAEHFGFNPEYISKLMKKSYGSTLKTIINQFLVSKAKDLLCNTNLFVSEIAGILGFTDCTAFVNYFKYHENTTPTKYRNIYSKTHMNIK